MISWVVMGKKMFTFYVSKNRHKSGVASAEARMSLSTRSAQ